MAKKAIIGIIVVLVLAGGGYAAYHFWPTTTYTFEMDFDYAVNGIYGENATFEEGLWSFDPITMSSVNAFTQTSEITSKGYFVTIQLKDEYCVAFTDLWCNASTDATVSLITVELFSGETKIYSTKQYNSEIFAFEYDYFFANLTVTVDIRLK